MVDEVGRGEEVSSPGMVCWRSMVLARGARRRAGLDRGSEEEQLEAVEFTFEGQQVDREILGME